jgi:hypothetical protein
VLALLAQPNQQVRGLKMPAYNAHVWVRCHYGILKTWSNIVVGRRYLSSSPPPPALSRVR